MFFLSSKSGSKLISLNGLTLLSVKGKGEYNIINPRKRNQNLKEREGEERKEKEKEKGQKKVKKESDIFSPAAQILPLKSIRKYNQ